jgi:hypothetical protein
MRPISSAIWAHHPVVCPVGLNQNRHLLHGASGRTLLGIGYVAGVHRDGDGSNNTKNRNHDHDFDKGKSFGVKKSGRLHGKSLGMLNLYWGLTPELLSKKNKKFRGSFLSMNKLKAEDQR